MNDIERKKKRKKGRKEEMKEGGRKNRLHERKKTINRNK